MTVCLTKCYRKMLMFHCRLSIWSYKVNIGIIRYQIHPFLYHLFHNAQVTSEKSEKSEDNLLGKNYIKKHLCISVTYHCSFLCKIVTYTPYHINTLSSSLFFYVLHIALQNWTTHRGTDCFLYVFDTMVDDSWHKMI